LDILQRIDIGTVIIQFAVLFFSLSVHEASHAWMADRLGDYTARYMGRVTLNPIAHIDPFGTLLFPLLLFLSGMPVIGWAKPVPVNPVHLKNPRRDQMFVSLAGPGSNLMAAGISFVVLAGLQLFSPVSRGILLNMTETMRVPHQQTVLAPLVGLLFFSLIINLALAIFNLIPIPPLDGHWMLYGILPYNAAQVLGRIGGFGILILYGLIFAGMLKYVFTPISWVISFLLLL